jgi:hypothetical protein
MLGCTNPQAVNYNAVANQEDNSCIYLERLGDSCYAFEDAGEDLSDDRSFTLSFALKQDSWVYFHDYVPDMYFHSRKQLYSLKDNRIYTHNKNLPGRIYGKTKPWFIDMVFVPQMEVLLDTLLWLTEVVDNGVDQEMKTITHITVWNSNQCTGRIALSTKNKWDNDLTRYQGLWTFNKLTDLVKNHGQPFLDDLFGDFRPLEENMDLQKPFYRQEQLQDNYFIVRFEFDNLSGEVINFHGANLTATPSAK